jgi:hypothetical protein
MRIRLNAAYAMLFLGRLVNLAQRRSSHCELLQSNFMFARLKFGQGGCALVKKYRAPGDGVQDHNGNDLPFRPIYAHHKRIGARGSPPGMIATALPDSQLHKYAPCGTY